MSTEDVAPPLARGRYRLIEVIGAGGMATVYRGHDERLSRNVAVKVMKKELAINQNLRERFVWEAKTMARLDMHRHVVHVYDFGQDEDDGRLFIAMELVGRSLQSVLDQHGRLPPRLAAEVMLQVLDALEIAHRHRIVHRDVKPSNILLTRDGSTKVSDFGIARIADRPGVTASGAGVGTWAYMAPEQKRNAGKVDHRADLYAVGATLFALLTRQEPNDLDRVETWSEQLDALPEPIRDVITRATRYQVDERYSSAAELRAALTAARDLLPPDPPGSESLMASGLHTSPEPPAPRVTLVPQPAPSPAAPSNGTYRPESGGGWSQINAPESDGALRRWGTLGALALLVTGLVWWWTRPPPVVEAPPPLAPAPEPPGLQERVLYHDGTTPTPVERETEDIKGPIEDTQGPKSNPVGSGSSTSSAGGDSKLVPPEQPPAPLPTRLVKLNVESDASCKVTMDGKPALDVTGKRLAAPSSATDIGGSIAASVPVGPHLFACENAGHLQAAETITEGNTPLTITLRAQ